MVDPLQPALPLASASPPASDETPPWRRLALDERCSVDIGRIPGSLLPDGPQLEALWALHPETSDRIVMYGRSLAMPRWQAAYGVDYRFSGQISRAAPIPPLLAPHLDWARTLDPRINGLLLNWYDAALGHKIGAHRDSRAGLAEGSPIVTVSLGASRVLRLKPYRGSGRVDIEVGHGDVVVISAITNEHWTHEVPHRARDQGRRISITSRAFVAHGHQGAAHATT